ncbi:MAG TPA: TIGR03435 family protein, partial [Bryobacteraceae bacterium]|nr:TIGR03435 family protein [Bryobacteraceae bacterium]
MRHLVAPILALSLGATMWAQAADTPKFEVAAIKPSPALPSSGDFTSGISSRDGLMRGVNATLKRYIMGAYAIGPNQVVGGPDWLDTDRFDITAKAEPPVGDGKPAGDHELMAMLQTLLAERFKLATHRDQKTIEAYVLEVAKGGPKLEKSEGGTSRTDNGRGNLAIKNTTMDRFAQVLSRQMDLPVVNHTGLEGAYNLQLKWSFDTTKGDGPSVFTAIQEQLGLRLKAQKT